MKRSGNPKYVDSFQDRHGKRRWRARRHGTTYYFRSAPGTDEFALEYQNWLAGVTLRPTPGEARTVPGSLSALISKYYRSVEWSALAPSTQVTYRGIFERLRAQHGEKPWNRLERKHVRELIAAKRDTPMAANNLLRMLRILGKFAIAEEWRNDDPTNGVRGIRVRSTGFHSWTEDEIDIFQQRWPVGTRECLAFRLLLYTAQRRADVIRMGRQHVRGNAIFVRQQKTGQELLIPIHPKLREVLDLETGQLTFLTTAYGAQFSAAGFGNWFRASCNAAGLRHCSAHGLRKASARRFAEQGCSANEIAAWTGHTTLKEVAGYTKAASQQLLAQRAMQRTLHEQNLANPKIGLAKKGRK